MRIGRRLALTACLASILLSAITIANIPEASSCTIYTATLDDDIINPPVAEYIDSAIEEAERKNATALVIKLDTPGGLLTSTRKIVKRIMNSKVPVVTYVAPEGARAGSAGVFITLASQVAAMAPSTNIGAAHPVDVAGDKQDSKESLGKVLRDLLKGDGKDSKEEEKALPPMEQKILNDTVAWMKAIAKTRGRNEEWAVKAVEESVSATAAEAKKLGVVDIIANSVEDLIAKLDGREITMGDRTIVLETKDPKIVDYAKGFRIKLLTALAHPNIAYILLMLGFYGLLFEFTNPGIGFPGIAGAFCLVLAFFGLQVLPTNYAGIALIALAIAMFIAEVKVTSYGLLTLGGLVALVIGSIILFRSPHDFMRVSIPLMGAFTLATLVIAIFLATIAARIQRRRVVTGAAGMAGERGEVQSWSGDRGKIFVHGEIWDAYGPEDLDRGSEVCVKQAMGMKLEVEKAEKKGSDC